MEPTNSTHKCEVFRVTGLTPVPNSDNLELVKFYNYECVVRKGDFHEGDLAVYIPPDNIVPDTPDYAFLGGHLRIKARRFRGTWSQGLVVKPPYYTIDREDKKVTFHTWTEGADAAVTLGVKHYVPPVKGSPFTGKTGGGNKWWKWNYSSFEQGPPVPGPYYDIESWWRYGMALVPGEEVQIREKIHGTNARFTWQSGRLWVASRSGYRRSMLRHIPWYIRLVQNLGLHRFFGVPARISKISEGVYWEAVRQNPWIEQLCRNNEGTVFYGEIFGDVQDLKYGAKDGQYFIKLFDAYWAPENPGDSGFLNPDDLEDLLLDFTIDKMYESSDLMAPLLYEGIYDEAVVKKLISGPSLTGPHLREGIVIKPLKERFERNLGRVILKAVSPAYLERTKD